MNPTNTSANPGLQPKKSLDNGIDFTNKIKAFFKNIKEILNIIGSIISYLTPVAFAFYVFLGNPKDYITKYQGPLLNAINEQFKQKIEVVPAYGDFKAITRTYLYNVQKNNRLREVAMHHHMTLEQVYALNPELRKNPDRILANETEIRLRIQDEYTVKLGDTFETIASKYFVFPEDLKRANHRAEKDYLEVDEIIVIPFQV